MSVWAAHCYMSRPVGDSCNDSFHAPNTTVVMWLYQRPAALAEVNPEGFAPSCLHPQCAMPAPGHSSPPVVCHSVGCVRHLEPAIRPEC